MAALDRRELSFFWRKRAISRIADAVRRILRLAIGCVFLVRNREREIAELREGLLLTRGVARASQ